EHQQLFPSRGAQQRNRGPAIGPEFGSPRRGATRGVIPVFRGVQQHQPFAYRSGSHSDIPAPAETASAAVATNSIGSGMTASTVHVKPELADITSTLVDYILSHHPSRFKP